jgi:peroxiredoxin
MLLLAALAGGCGAYPHPTLAIGAPAPPFSLPGVDGNLHTLAEYAQSPVLAVVFTCNHCPASELYERRIQQLHADYRASGVAVVAINPESPASVPAEELAYSDVGESLEEMKVRAAFRHLEYPYLYDGDAQAAVSAFGPAALPQVFVFDRQRTLRYVGRIDDNRREDLVRTRDARNAIDALLAGRPVPVSQTTALGCAPAWLPKSPQPVDATTTAPEPVTLHLAGLEDLKKLRQNGTSRLMVVNFWATWCAPCAVEFPDLQATYRMYRGRNVQLITVSANTPDEQSGVLTFLREQHASSDNRLFASDDTAAMQNAFDPLMPASVPFTLLIAPNGDVLHQQLGEINFPELRRAILASLPDDEKSQGLQTYWSMK